MTDTQKEDKLERLATSCNGCIFAEHSSGLTQIGCQLGRLEKFEAQNRAKLHEAHYIIDGICNTCRGNKWLERRSFEREDPISTVMREVEVNVDVVLYSVDDICDNLDWKVGQAVRAVTKQEKIKPRKVVVVVKNNSANFTTLYDTIQEIAEEYDIPFQLMRVMENDADVGRSIEMGIDKCNHQFTVTFDVEHKIPTNFIERLNTIVNEDLVRFILIDPMYSYNGMVIPTNMFELLGKNYNFPIFEKIKEVANEQRKENLIITWESLWTRK